MQVNLLDIKRITGFYSVELAEILDTSVPQVEAWLVDPSTMPVDTWGDLYTLFELATLDLDERGLTWDQVHTMRYVGRQLFVTQPTLEALLRQRKLEPIDLDALGLWLTDEQVAKCRQLP